MRCTVIIRAFKILACVMLALTALPHTASAQKAMPQEAVIRLKEAARICEQRFQKFSYDMNFLHVLNLNGDGHDDYVLSSEGFMCDNSHTFFSSDDGNQYFVYTTRSDRTLHEYKDTIIALGLKINDETFPQQLDFIMPCRPGLANIGHYGLTTLQWRKDEMKIVGRKIGCNEQPTPPRTHSGKSVTPPSSVVVPVQPATPVTP